MLGPMSNLLTYNYTVATKQKNKKTGPVDKRKHSKMNGAFLFLNIVPKHIGKVCNSDGKV